MWINDFTCDFRNVIFRSDRFLKRRKNLNQEVIIFIRQAKLKLDIVTI